MMYSDKKIQRKKSVVQSNIGTHICCLIFLFVKYNIVLITMMGIVRTWPSYSFDTTEGLGTRFRATSRN